MKQIDVKKEFAQGILGVMLQGYRIEEQDLLIGEITFEVADKWGIAQEISFGETNIQFVTEVLREAKSQYAVFWWKEQDDNCLAVFSNSKAIRAIEYMDYLMSEFGLVRGDSGVACGRISGAILQVQMNQGEAGDEFSYFRHRAQMYFKECQCIFPEEYGKTNNNEIANWKTYQKKKVTWAYVKSTQIVPQGKRLLVRSLENESGQELCAQDDLYIMIGFHGEIYDISREKFENTYDATDELLDINEKMMKFIPEICTLPDGEYVLLDEIAHLCYPKGGASIRAKQLEGRTKVYPKNHGEEYFLGRKGDYLACRLDDPQDIYIIKEDIFGQTYEAIF